MLHRARGYQAGRNEGGKRRTRKEIRDGWDRENGAESTIGDEHTRRSHWIRIEVLLLATVTHMLFMYRFFFQTSNFGTRARAYVIKRVTRFKRFRGFETSDCVRCPAGFYRRRDVHDSITWQKYFARCTRSELLICCYYLRFVFAPRESAYSIYSIYDEYSFYVWTSEYFRTSSRCW